MCVLLCATCLVHCEKGVLNLSEEYYCCAAFLGTVNHYCDIFYDHKFHEPQAFVFCYGDMQCDRVVSEVAKIVPIASKSYEVLRDVFPGNSALTALFAACCHQMMAINIDRLGKRACLIHIIDVAILISRKVACDCSATLRHVP